MAHQRVDAHVLTLVLALFISLTMSPRAEAQGGPPRPGPQCVTGCLGTISVTPDGASLSVNANTTGNNASFGLVFSSSTTTARTFTLTCSRSGGVTCGTITPSSVTLQGPNDDAMVTVGYNVSSTGGTLTLRASYGTGSIQDNGFYNIQVRGAPVVALRNHNRDNIDRSLCLTADAGESAAWSCGDLVVTHAMPAFTTLGRGRSPTLIHNSGTAYPRPAIAAVVTQPTGRAEPTAVLAELSVNGAVKTSAMYTGWPTGTTGARQLVLDYNAAGDSTGVYPIRFRVQNQYTGFAAHDAFVDDTVIVVNRFFGEFGAGFGLAGLERLVLNQPVGSGLDHILWVSGDGSAKLYRKQNATTWIAPLGGFQDTLTFDGTNYTRIGRHRVQVKFNSGGRHIETRPRTGQTTVFNWTGNRLTSIVLPPLGQTYVLGWDGGGTGNLDYIDDPSGRRLDVTVGADGRLYTIFDPDGKRLDFGWDGDRRLIWRKDRRGFTTTFQYSNGLAFGSRITKVTTPAGVAVSDTATSVTVYEPWNDKGLAPNGSTGQTAVDTGQAYTKVLGPRPNVADDATFWVDRWGAPTRIVNAINATTTLVRGDPLLPALVTSVSFPNGRNVTMAYSARGNLALLRDINSVGAVGAGAMPTKVAAYTYSNANAPDSPTIVADSINGGAYRSLYTYTTDGLTETVTDRRGHTTRFVTRASGSLRGVIDSIVDQQVETWNVGNGDVADAPADHVVSFTYNTQGNVTSTKSPTGVVTSSVPDGMGRVTDSYGPLGEHQQWAYDAMNRVTSGIRFTAKTAHPANLDPLQTCDALQVICGDSTRTPDASLGNSLLTQHFHGAAGIDSVTDPRGNTRRLLYDARGLLWQDLDEYNRPRIATYDRAGGLVEEVSRIYPPTPQTPNPHRDTVSVQYDALGRRTMVAYSSTPYSSSSGIETVPADTIRYTYDNMSNLLTVTNAAGSIVRTYYGDGSIRTQKVALPGGTDSVAFNYDSTGARVRAARTSGGNTDAVTYAYHPSTGDLVSITVQWGPPANTTSTLSFVWDGLGRRRQITYPNNMVVKFRYDKQGILRRLQSVNPANVPLVNDRFDLTYRADSVDASARTMFQVNLCQGFQGTDGGGAGSACTVAQPGVLGTTSRYDRLAMLVSQRTDGELPQTYLYDKAGNLSLRQDGAVQHHYRMAPESNRLLVDSIPGQTSSQVLLFGYTANGSRLREFTANEATGGNDEKRFYYDGMGRPTGIRDFDHDAAGRATCMRYDPDGQLALPCDDNPSWLTFDGPNVAGTLGLRWVFVSGPGVDDPLIGLYRNPSSGPKEFYWITDGRGRQLAVGVADGSLGGQDRTDYLFNGGKFAGGSQNSHSFGSSRFESPIAPGFSSYRNRLYDQSTGRWTQEDPIGVAGGLNLYQFNGNNPVAYTDPFGLCTKEEKERGNATQSDVCASDIGTNDRNLAQRYAKRFMEAGMLSFGLLDAAIGAGIARSAWGSAPRIAGFAGRRADPDAIEAARHQVWMCWTSGALGEAFAKGAAAAHEYGEAGSADSKRDWANNERGLGYARGGGSCVSNVTNGIRGNPIPREQDYSE